MIKKLIFTLILIIVCIYFFSGRVHIVQQNINERGMSALIDEPLWLYHFVGDHWKRFRQGVSDAIDGKRLGPDYSKYEKK